MQRILRGQTRSPGVPEKPAEIRGWPASLGSPIGTASRVRKLAPCPFSCFSSCCLWLVLVAPLNATP